MPPRSTNTPKSAMFLTMPLRIWPSWMSVSRLSFCVSRSSSSSLRREMTMFMRSSSILMIRARIGSPMKSEMSCVRRMLTWRRRQEDGDALDVDEQAALDLALDDALDLVAFVVLGRDALPAAQAVGAALGELRGVVLVEALVEDLVGLAGLGQRSRRTRRAGSSPRTCRRCPSRPCRCARRPSRRAACTIVPGRDVRDRGAAAARRGRRR